MFTPETGLSCRLQLLSKILVEDIPLVLLETFKAAVGRLEDGSELMFSRCVLPCFSLIPLTACVVLPSSFQSISGLQ